MDHILSTKPQRHQQEEETSPFALAIDLSNPLFNTYPINKKCMLNVVFDQTFLSNYYICPENKLNMLYV